MNADLERFFRNYAKLYTAALGDAPDFDAITACFAPCFIAAGPSGVQCGENGPELKRTLEQAFAFYKSIGTQRMQVERVQRTEIDTIYAMAKVYYRADYLKKSGEAVSIPFSVAYLLQLAADGAKIFAFVAEDEMEAYKRAGLID